MSDPLWHHYVPRMYPKAWCDPNEGDRVLWVPEPASSSAMRAKTPNNRRILRLAAVSRAWSAHSQGELALPRRAAVRR
jgi:hypothetical protein